MLSRLSHINPAIILSASKVILKFSGSLENAKIVEALCKKISNSLISILSRSPEIVWVFLKNIEIFLIRFPTLFTNIKAFYVNVTDPCFVKMQKVQILNHLCDENSVKIIANEFSEYAYDQNVEFSRFSFSSLWRIAAKFESSFELVVRLINQLLVNSQEVGFIDHILNESAIACDYLFRKHQNIGILSETFSIVTKNYNRINKNDSICALLNVLPYFSHTVKESFEIIKSQIDNFLGSAIEVQLSVLSATVKLFTIDSTRYQEFVQTLFEIIDKNVELPELRDRAFIYWRLLDLNPEIAQTIIMGKREKIDFIDPTQSKKSLFEELFDRVGGISATLQEIYFTKDRASKGLETDSNYDQIEPVVQPIRGNEILQLYPEEPQVLEQQKDSQIIQNQVNNNNILNLDFGNAVLPTKLPVQHSTIIKNSNLELLISDFSLQNTVQSPLFSDPIPIQKEVKGIEDKYSSFNLLNLDVSNTKSSQNLTTLIGQNDSKKIEKDVFNFDYDNNSKTTLKSKKTYLLEFKNKPQQILVNKLDKGFNNQSGVQITGNFRRDGQFLFLTFTIENGTDFDLTDVCFDIKPNLFGLVLRQSETDEPINAKESLKIDLPIGFDIESRLKDWSTHNNFIFDMEVKTNVNTWSFKLQCFLNNLLVR